MDAPTAYLNGRWIARSELCISVDDVGFLQGATVTERLRTFRGQVFRLDEHVRRLRRSLAIVGLPVDEIASQIAQAAPEFVLHNQSLLGPGDDWSIAAFATPGAAGASRPTVCVHGNPLPFHMWAANYETGIRVVISDIRQIPPQCLPPELKCRAASTQPGARAILLDENGHIAEATTANVLIYRDGEGIVTPPHDHILFGVSLGVVQELAASLNMRFVTRPLTVKQFRAADEAMLTSTSVCLLPIVQCNGQPIGRGQAGPVYRQLLAAWNDLVGVDVADQARRFASRAAL
jgi:branched-subunit amino acid aminotransferase/4-amino-4-deoxychorismate lyase